MQRRVPVVLLFFGAVLLSACADQRLTEPETAVAAAPGGQGKGRQVEEPAAPPDVELPPRHLVVFDGRTPAGFAARVANLGGSVLFASDAIGAAGVEGLDEDGAASLGGLTGVSVVEPEPVLPLAEPVSVSDAAAMDAAALEAAVSSPANPAAAFFFPRQWNLRVVRADAAWAAGRTGASDVTVAILDTGIGYAHADLAGRVDLSRSVSFVPLDDIYVDFFFPGAHPIADIGYHGTHVAATVASNGLAAAGVTSGVTLMGVKVCSVVSGGCGGVGLMQGMLHAIENGADVANMSLGGWFARASFPGFVSTLNRMANYAKQRNVTFVVSAGNQSIDLDQNDEVPITDPETGEVTLIAVPSLYKTFCDNTHVLCVSATGPTAAAGVNGPWAELDAPAVYTNFGRSAIDVAAPGGNTGGSVWAACSPFSLVLPICQTGTFVVGISGTSMAAPHVSGLAALAVEDVGRNVAAVRDYVRNSADAIGGGNTPYYGKGRINVARAVGAH